jgi:hypothetical protein
MKSLEGMTGETFGVTAQRLLVRHVSKTELPEAAVERRFAADNGDCIRLSFGSLLESCDSDF